VSNWEFIEIEKKDTVELPNLGGVSREGAREVTWTEVLIHFLWGIAQPL
jgi:hypothetical protein